jgi:hypothetical protein
VLSLHFKALIIKLLSDLIQFRLLLLIELVQATWVMLIYVVELFFVSTFQGRHLLLLPLGKLLKLLQMPKARELDLLSRLQLVLEIFHALVNVFWESARLLWLPSANTRHFCMVLAWRGSQRLEFLQVVALDEALLPSEGILLGLHNR